MASPGHDGHQCDAAVTRAFSVLGKRWNGMIVAVLGDGPTSFVALRRAVSGISDAVLSERLAGLVDMGLIVRDVDAGPPVSVRYRLTDAGERLVPILDQLGAWADGNLAASG
ncbi:helix-turn-helix domain-containing protein [Microbacterium sp. 18062]|uniref:winged helix-turn-helix transcriptional regulator n=1 Tax=Microbacterium sp. 18062 TaxID=2681410 RepID=UPI001358AD5B|nr:helix-turn-helix domain-containing protein [Microbacterium sp. 18062]